MLYIIGLGLDKEDITLKGMEALRKCQKIYLERYTSYVDVLGIEKSIGMSAIPATRKMVEESSEILEEAKTKDVAFLVSGDPLAATTHMDLILRAKKMGIKTEVIHSVSIFNAISEIGLQLYKFGKTASIPKWQESYKPQSFYNIIEENDVIKAHTLLLMDIGLDVQEALSYLKSIAKERDDKKMLDKKMIVCEEVGTGNRKFTIGKISALIKKKFKVPVCIIIPNELHFMEEEALKALT